MLFNARESDAGFVLPAGEWRVELDSAEPHGIRYWQGSGGSTFVLRSRSLVLLANDASSTLS